MIAENKHKSTSVDSNSEETEQDPNLQGYETTEVDEIDNTKNLFTKSIPIKKKPLREKYFFCLLNNFNI